MAQLGSPSRCMQCPGSTWFMCRSSSPTALHSRLVGQFRRTAPQHSSSRTPGCRRHAVAHSRANPPCAQQQQQPQREDRSAGRDTYRPASFQVVIDDASRAVLAGMEDGLTRMEVELPSVGVDSE